MCDKVVDNYSHELEFVSDRYKTQKMYTKGVNFYPFEIQLFPELCIT